MSQQPPSNPFTSYPPSKVYRLIEPGPVLLLSTGPATKAKHKSKPQRDASSNDINIMTMGFHMMVQHSGPPLIAACIGPWDATYARLKAARECVLAVPSVEMAETVVDIGNCSMDDLGSSQGPSNKFEKFGLDALPAAKVGAPLVGAEHVIANVECVVEDDVMVDRYNLWVFRVVKAWVNEGKKPGEGGRMFHHRGDGTFSVDGEEVLDLRERMVKWKMFQD
jgi:flavin reductase (DIM6/NTAB) family NADH-FMN oxidoreductase RutF